MLRDGQPGCCRFRGPLPKTGFRLERMTNNLARMATLEQLEKTIVPAFLNPPPSRDTLRDWFDTARIPRFKNNPSARRGGGPVYYQVSAVEKYLQGRTLPCRLPPVPDCSRN